MRISLVLVAALAVACSRPKPAAQPAPPADPPPVTEPTTDPGAPPAATPSDAELDAMFAETLSFFDDMAAAMAANESDCARMAAAVTANFDKYATLLTRAKSFEGNAEVDAKADAYMEANKDRVNAATAKMGAGFNKCGSHPDMEAAVKRFDTM